jgi:hypothetical protein
MYVIEGTQPIQSLHGLGSGDVLVFSRLPGGTLLVSGRQGGEEDVRRRAPVRLMAKGAPAAQRARAPGAVSARVWLLQPPTPKRGRVPHT